MSVIIDESPIFGEKKAVHFDRGVFANVILSSSYIHFEGRIMNLIVSINGHCISGPSFTKLFYNMSYLML